MHPQILQSTIALIAALSVFLGNTSRAGQFEALGVPVKVPDLMGVVVGADAQGSETLYFNCAQPGDKLFLLQVNPKTDEVRQFGAPAGEGAWAMIEGPDKCIYLGTWESGYLLKFDPKTPEKGIVSLGKPSSTETYIWQLALGKDQRLYGCTYPNAKLVRYDPRSGKSEDLGRMDSSEMYARSVAASANGLIYVGIGTVHPQIVRFDPVTGQSKALLENSLQLKGTARVIAADDGQVYASIGEGYRYRCDGDSLQPVKVLPQPPAPVLHDGRSIKNLSVQGDRIVYELADKSGAVIKKSAKFEGTGIRVFSVGAGPKGVIYGSTALPLEMFEFSPATSKLKHLGNPTSVGGEIYSYATDGTALYACAYPNSFLSIYDPQKPWKYGRKKGANPRGFGPIGDGHLRPRAMIMGDDGRAYVGSLPPYGQRGGALGIYDPKKDAVVENYRNIVTNQGLTALCIDEKSKRLFGGSSIEAGGGARPIAKECVVFAWDRQKKQKEWEQVVIPGDTEVVGLTAAKGKLFGVSRPSNTMFVIDGANFSILRKAKIAFGPVHEASFEYYPSDNRIYGLAGDSIFAVDPATFNAVEVARSNEPINCGFAVTETGIYFGSGSRLIRWRWQ